MVHTFLIFALKTLIDIYCKYYLLLLILYGINELFIILYILIIKNIHE